MQFVIQVNLQFSGQFQFVLGKASVSAAVILKFSNTVILLPWSSVVEQIGFISFVNCLDCLGITFPKFYVMYL